MQDPFDPYGAWLSLPPGPRPPDYYQLLGLAAFYPDMAAIAASADQRIAYVQQFLNGPYAPVATQLLNELIGARNMLLNPQGKAVYDAELYRCLQGAAAPQYAPAQMAAAHGYGNNYGQPVYAQPSYVPQSEPSAPVVSVRSRRNYDRSRSSLAEVPVVILAIVVFGVLGVGRYLIWNMRGPNPTTHEQPVAHEKPGAVPLGTSTDIKPPSKVDGHAKTITPNKVKTPAERMPETVGPAEMAAVNEALNAARVDISDRKFTAAGAKLEAAKQLAVSHAAKQEVQNVQALLHYARGFWNVVQSSWKNQTAGNELTVGGETMVVVEVTPETIIIRSAGQNRDYNVQRMPFAMALAFGESWLTKGDPNSNVFLAAFHLTEYKGDRKKARQLLNLSASAGIDVDGLLKELDLAEKKK